MNKSSPSAYYSLIFIFVASISTIGLLLDRHQSIILGLAYFLAFFSYFWLVKFYSESNVLFPLGIFIRIILFVGLPTLSDDIYRFIWDGHILANSLNPYLHVPEFYLSETHFSGLTPDLFNKLNSKPYFTIYPPLNQLIFWIGVKFGGGNYLIATNVIRGFIMAAEIGSFYFLKKILIHNNRNPNLAYWLFLNPLIILEFTGNVHFEAIVIFFLLMGLHFLNEKKMVLGGFSIGGAIATKLVPFIFLPAILFKLKWKNGILVVGFAMMIAGVTLIPLISPQLISNLHSSLDLYFRKFEFNASIYFLFREIGYFFTGYNIIGKLGPVLSLIDFIAILLISLYGARAGWKLEKTILFILLIHLSLSTTVHPWYILPLIPLGIISGYYFPILWSLFIFSTYLGYTPGGYEPSAFWLVSEYMCLFVFLTFEIFNHKNVSLD